MVSLRSILGEEEDAAAEEEAWQKFSKVRIARLFSSNLAQSGLVSFSPLENQLSVRKGQKNYRNLLRVKGPRRTIGLPSPRRCTLATDSGRPSPVQRQEAGQKQPGRDRASMY